MRLGVLLMAAAALGACSMLPTFGEDWDRTATILTPADAATSLISGGPLTLTRLTPRGEPEDGMDPLIKMSLARGDGRTLSFTEANHTPYDVMAQAAGGQLANAMGFFGEEAPTLYARDGEASGDAPFICGAEGPAYVGVYRDELGAVTIVGLRSGFEFEPVDGGGYNPLPYSPDHVCARMKFTAQ